MTVTHLSKAFAETGLENIERFLSAQAIQEDCDGQVSLRGTQVSALEQALGQEGRLFRALQTAHVLSVNDPLGQAIKTCGREAIHAMRGVDVTKTARINMPRLRELAR